MKWTKKTNDLTELKDQIDNIDVVVNAIAADKRLERMETLLNTLVADVRIGRYCSFRGTDWDKQKK